MVSTNSLSCFFSAALNSCVLICKLATMIPKIFISIFDLATHNCLKHIGLSTSISYAICWLQLSNVHHHCLTIIVKPCNPWIIWQSINTIQIGRSAVVYWIEPLTLDQRVAGSIPVNAWHFLSFSKTLYPHCCSPPRCINGYLVEFKYYLFLDVAMCALLKWYLARMLPRELRRCTMRAGLILNPVMTWVIRHCIKSALSSISY